MIGNADIGLERLSGAGNPLDWDEGNSGANYIAGGLLIIQENALLSSAPTYGLSFNMVTYNFFNVKLADFEEDVVNYLSTLYGVGEL
jgi:hypothetical protein